MPFLTHRTKHIKVFKENNMENKITLRFANTITFFLMMFMLI